MNYVHIVYRTYFNMWDKTWKLCIVAFMQCLLMQNSSSTHYTTLHYAYTTCAYTFTCQWFYGQSPYPIPLAHLPKVRYISTRNRQKRTIFLRPRFSHFICYRSITKECYRHLQYSLPYTGSAVWVSAARGAIVSVSWVRHGIIGHCKKLRATCKVREKKKR